LPRKGSTRRKVKPSKKLDKRQKATLVKARARPRAQPKTVVKKKLPARPRAQNTKRAPKKRPSLGKKPAVRKALPKRSSATRERLTAPQKWPTPKRKGKRAAQERAKAARRRARQEEKRRVEELVREVWRSQLSRRRTRSEAARKSRGTRAARDAREEYFDGASREELLRHYKNNTPEWQAYLEVATRAARWDSRRIRDEFFSPKVRGKK
jgi:hypothetical protein